MLTRPDGRRSPSTVESAVVIAQAGIVTVHDDVQLVPVGGYRKNNHPKRAWRQVRLEIEAVDWRLCGRARTEISTVAKSWNAVRTGFPGLRSQAGIRRSFSGRACAGLRCRDARCAAVALAVVTLRPRRVPVCARWMCPLYLAPGISEKVTTPGPPTCMGLTMMAGTLNEISKALSLCSCLA